MLESLVIGRENIYVADISSDYLRRLQYFNQDLSGTILDTSNLYNTDFTLLIILDKSHIQQQMIKKSISVNSQFG